MKTLKNLERLQHLHNLITNENTGSPAEIAKKMNVSERLVFILIDQLKDLKASIRYDRKSKTYYYCDNFELHISISVSVISNKELTKIFAGSYFIQENSSLQGLCGGPEYISSNKTKICA